MTRSQNALRIAWAVTIAGLIVMAPVRFREAWGIGGGEKAVAMSANNHPNHTQPKERPHDQD